jgi:hypothetical protein
VQRRRSADDVELAGPWVCAGAGPVCAEAAAAELHGGERASGVGAVPSVRPAELLPQLRPRDRAGRLLLRVPVRARRLRAAAAVEADGDEPCWR